MVANARHLCKEKERKGKGGQTEKGWSRWSFMQKRIEIKGKEGGKTKKEGQEHSPMRGKGPSLER